MTLKRVQGETLRVVKEIKDTHLTLRVAKSLKDEIEGIAEEVRRSLNNTAELLLIKGIEAYRAENGVLVDARPKNGDPQASISTQVSGTATDHLNVTDINPRDQVTPDAIATPPPGQVEAVVGKDPPTRKNSSNKKVR